MKNDNLRKEFVTPTTTSSKEAAKPNGADTTLRNEEKPAPTLKFSPEVQYNLDLMHG